jgi:hypothetical protein
MRSCSRAETQRCLGGPVDRLARRAPAETGEAPEGHEVLAHGQVGVEANLLRHEPDAAQRAPLGVRPTIDQDRALARGDAAQMARISVVLPAPLGPSNP